MLKVYTMHARSDSTTPLLMLKNNYDSALLRTAGGARACASLL